MYSIDYWQFREDLDSNARHVNELLAATAGVAGPDDAGGPRASGGPAAAVAPSAYLEQDTNRTADVWVGGEVKTIIKVGPHNCRSWCCPTCCRSMGKALRDKAVEAAERWDMHPMMITLTIDPEVFDGDAFEALLYTQRKKKKAISRTVERLFRAGHLRSKHYLAVVEIQPCGFPHWHVLLDSDFIPFEALKDAWNANLDGKDGFPSAADRIALGRPGFGGVKFSKPKGFKSVRHAIFYITKYVVKPPKTPWPAWVLAITGRHFRRYSHSQGFFAYGSDVEQPAWVTETTDAPEVAASVAEPLLAVAEPLEKEHRKPARTIGEVVRSCGVESVLVWQREVEDLNQTTGETRSRVLSRHYIGKLLISVAEVVNRAFAAGLADHVKLRGTVTTWIELDPERAGEFLAAVGGPGVEPDRLQVLAWHAERERVANVGFAMG